MPDTGAPYYLPYPQLPNEADFPDDNQALAVASHAAMAQPLGHMARLKNVSQPLTTASTYYKVTWEYAEPSQPASGISIGGDNATFTIIDAGVWLINVTLHFTITTAGGTNTINIDVLVGDGTALNNIAWNNYIGPNDSALTLQKSLRFKAGGSFYVNARSSVTGTVAYGSGSRYSTIDAVRIGN